MRLPFPKGRYDAAGAKKLFFQQVLQRVTTLPGVVAATETASLPPYGVIESEITVPGKTHSESWKAQLQLCSEGYFQTLGRRLIRGKTLSEVDVASARHVVVITQPLARNYFQQEDPIGKTIKFNFLDRVADAPHQAYFEIVGIVGDAKNQGVRDPPMPEAFAPYAITGAFNRGILVRTTADPLLMLASVRREIWAVDSSVALTMTGSLEDYLKRFSYAGPKFSLSVQRFCGDRPGVGDDRSIQCDGLHGVAADARDWGADGAWRPAKRYSADGAQERSGLDRNWHRRRRPREPGPDAFHGQPDLGCFGSRSLYLCRGSRGPGRSRFGRLHSAGPSRRSRRSTDRSEI